MPPLDGVQNFFSTTLEAVSQFKTEDGNVFFNDSFFADNAQVEQQMKAQSLANRRQSQEEFNEQRANIINSYIQRRNEIVPKSLLTLGNTTTLEVKTDPLFNSWKDST
jgi:hypothetical protein